MQAGKNHGFAFPVIIFAIAILGIGLAALGTAWSDLSRRERESQLIRIGTAYANAIAQYYKSSPGTVKHYPKYLDDLLSDNRFVSIQRHLRQLYPDPMTKQKTWGLITDSDGTIKGVYSLSNAVPLKQVSFETGSIHLAAAKQYSDWKFVVEIPGYAKAK